MGCKAINENEVFASAGVIDMGQEAVNGDNGFAGARVIDVGHEAIDKDDSFAGACVDEGCGTVDEGHGAEDGDGILASIVTSSLTAFPGARVS